MIVTGFKRKVVHCPIIHCSTQAPFFKSTHTRHLNRSYMTCTKLLAWLCAFRDANLKTSVVTSVYLTCCCHSGVSSKSAYSDLWPLTSTTRHFFSSHHCVPHLVCSSFLGLFSVKPWSEFDIKNLSKSSWCSQFGLDNILPGLKAFHFSFFLDITNTFSCCHRWQAISINKESKASKKWLMAVDLKKSKLPAYSIRVKSGFLKVVGIPSC